MLLGILTVKEISKEKRKGDYDLDWHLVDERSASGVQVLTEGPFLSPRLPATSSFNSNSSFAVGVLILIVVAVV